jgi:hypothetical protein
MVRLLFLFRMYFPNPYFKELHSNTSLQTIETCLIYHFARLYLLLGIFLSQRASTRSLLVASKETLYA